MDQHFQYPPGHRLEDRPQGELTEVLYKLVDLFSLDPNDIRTVPGLVEVIAWERERALGDVETAEQHAEKLTEQVEGMEEAFAGMPEEIRTKVAAEVARLTSTVDVRLDALRAKLKGEIEDAHGATAALDQENKVLKARIVELNTMVADLAWPAGDPQGSGGRDD